MMGGMPCFSIRQFYNYFPTFDVFIGEDIRHIINGSCGYTGFVKNFKNLVSFVLSDPSTDDIIYFISILNAVSIRTKFGICDHILSSYNPKNSFCHGLN